MVSKMDSQHAAVAVLTGMEMAHLMSQFNPSLFTIEGLVIPESRQSSVRTGYMIAFAEGMVLAYAVSYIMKTSLPLYFSAVVGLFAIAIYELALQSKLPDISKIIDGKIGKK